MLALLVGLVAASSPQAFDLREGTLSYSVVHKLHEVKGVSHTLEGKALLQPGGTLRVQVRARVASFDSGNSNRDEHMREVTHEPAHPYVQIKGSAAGVALPISAPVDLTLDCNLDFNGVQRRQTVPARLERTPAGIRATFAFAISLEAFQIERPELLFVRVDDEAKIEGDLLFAEAP
jgi:hypothetical protein